MSLRQLYIFYSLNAGIDFRRQNLTSLTSKDDIRADRVELNKCDSPCEKYIPTALLQLFMVFMSNMPIHLTHNASSQSTICHIKVQYLIKKRLRAMQRHLATPSV